MFVFILPVFIRCPNVKCYNCNSELDSNFFFWLATSRKIPDQSCLAVMDLTEFDIEEFFGKDNFDLFKIQCCSNCNAEQ